MEKIAILRWESGHVPQGLMQLEQLPGNSTNPASYPFPVKLVEVKGANTDTVILHPSQKLLEDMIQLAKELEKEGVRAITTSCGFNAIFQEALANAVDIPVFTSSLLQVPFAQALVGRDRAVGVITASASSLSDCSTSTARAGSQRAESWDLPCFCITGRAFHPASFPFCST